MKRKKLRKGAGDRTLKIHWRYVMRKIMAFIILFGFMFGYSLALGSDPTSKTHFYSIEYKKPREASGKVGILLVVFYDKINSKQTEDFLRVELNRAIALYPTSWDILAKAFYSTGDYLNEKQISLIDKSDALIYDSKSKKIYTSIQLWGTNFPPLTPKK
jgi:hypothetical protein